MQQSLSLRRGVFLLLWYCVYTLSAVSFPYAYPLLNLKARLDAVTGTPLFISPFLRNSSVNLAQDLSKVSLTTKMGIESHAGFFTVDYEMSSNLFFWYFPAFDQNTKAPVVLWLQGGPGGSSLFGLFTEIGPLSTNDDVFTQRKYHWARKNHLIFIDNPVGTGFSFTRDENGFCEDQQCIGESLHEALQQFFTLFPKLRKNKFYITGESYAGKYIATLAMVIHQRNNLATDKINLIGMAMGNAFCDPVHQLDYGNYLYQHGLLDHNQLQVFLSLQGKIEKAIKLESWAQANRLMDLLMDGGPDKKSYFSNYTGFKNYYNILKSYEDLSAFATLLQKVKVRKSIHVGGLAFNSGEKVQKHLELDILKSVAQIIEKLLSHYKILMYNGQLDIIVAYPLQEKFLHSLTFDSSDKYKKARREIWIVRNQIAGYLKRAGNLTELLIRNAGHMVPHDQPEWAYRMITQFIRGSL